MDMLEIFTEIMFDAAVIIMIFKIVYNIKNDNLTERFTAITMGFGFLIYCILKVLSGGTRAAFILAALGFMLSYTAFVFTFSRE